jgi:hypothetical protein
MNDPAFVQAYARAIVLEAFNFVGISQERARDALLRATSIMEIEFPLAELVAVRLCMFVLFNVFLMRVVRGRFLVRPWVTMSTSIALITGECFVHWGFSALCGLWWASPASTVANAVTTGIPAFEWYCRMVFTGMFALCHHIAVPFYILCILPFVDKFFDTNTTITSAMMSSLMSQLSTELGRKMKEAMSPAVQPVASASAPVLVPTRASTVVGMDSEGVAKQEEDSEPEPGDTTSQRPLVKPVARKQKSVVVTLPHPCSTVGSHPVNFMQNSAGALASRYSHPPASAPSPIPSGFASSIPYQYQL